MKFQRITTCTAFLDTALACHDRTVEVLANSCADGRAYIGPERLQRRGAAPRTRSGGLCCRGCAASSCTAEAEASGSSGRVYASAQGGCHLPKEGRTLSREATITCVTGV